jgi:hypothetical protein
MFSHQAFDRLYADPDTRSSAAELAVMDFEPQAGFSSLNAEDWLKAERDLRTSLAFASVFVKLTKTEFVTMLRRMVAFGEADVSETTEVIETIAGDLDSAKRLCQRFADLLGAANARLSCSAAVLELERRSHLSADHGDVKRIRSRRTS